MSTDILNFKQPKTHIPTVKKSWWSSLAKKMVMNALQSMRQGALVLTLPNGETLHLGDAHSPLKADIQIKCDQFFDRILLHGHIGFAESYIAGDWETSSIASVVSWAILNVDNSPVLEGSKNQSWSLNLLGTVNRCFHWLRENNLTNSQANIRAHYDLGNDFFALFLDSTKTYSSAKFEHSHQTLEEAQLAKYESLCQKVKLRHTDHVLEIGTGWGGFSLYAARHFGCQVTTITISKAQFEYVTQRIQEEGLADKITVQLCDYREMSGQFDKIVSIEMLEAVGDQYFETYFKQCANVLKPNGLLGIQYITCPDSRYTLLKSSVDFIQKHVFPGSLIPSVGRVNQAINRTGDLSLHSLDDLGDSYAKTLKLWHQAFNEHLELVRRMGFDEAFIRKWNYYLEYCRAAFEMRNLSVVQAVYTRPNNLLLSASWQERSAIS